MRKVKIAAVTLLMLGLMPSANADVYVKVDANGNAVGQAIMCDAGTCADGSAYSKATLAPGERYVLQNQGHAGIGNNNPGVEVKVDLETNQWTATSTTVKEVAPIQVTPEVKVTKVEVVNQTTWNPTVAPQPKPVLVAPIQTTTVATETGTVTVSTTPQSTPQPGPTPEGATMTTTQIIKPWFELDLFEWESFWQEFSAWLEASDWNWND